MEERQVLVDKNSSHQGGCSMLASEVIRAYEAFCPQEFSMEGDSRGLQIGTLDKDIQRVMVALDIREETVAEAIERVWI